MQFETIHTPRLLLRKITPEVYRFVFTHYTEEELQRFFGFHTEEDRLKEHERFEKGVSTFNKSFAMFQLLDNISGKVIGSCGYHTWYLEHRRAEVGYALTNDEFKQKGLMKEALGAVLQYGFNVMNLHRVEAFVAPENEPSLKLVRHFAFTQEGHLREHYFKNGVVEDSIVFSLLQSEYRQQTKP